MLLLTSLWALYTNTYALRQSATSFVPLLQCLSRQNATTYIFAGAPNCFVRPSEEWLCCGFPLSGVTYASAVLIHC